MRSGQRSRRPPGPEQLQQTLRGTLHRSKTRPGWFLAFQLPHSGLMRREVIVPIPQEVIDGAGAEGARSNVYLRYCLSEKSSSGTEVSSDGGVTEVRERAAVSDPRQEPAEDNDFEDDTPTSPETPIARTRPGQS